MKVSVVVPAYNVEHCLGRAIQSVIDTNCRNLEVLVVEDGSEDDTLGVAQAIQTRNPEKIKLFRHSGGFNRGAGASRNLGITVASGEVISFLDADDCYLANRFDNCLEVFERRADVDAVYERASVVKERYLHSKLCLKESLPPIDINSDERATITTALHHPWNTNSITIKREAFVKVGLFNETLKIGQDAEMWIRMAALANLVAGKLDQPVAVYHRHADNRYNDCFDRTLKGRVNIWISAYGAMRRGSVEAKHLCELRKSIIGKVVYKSNGLRQQGEAMESLKYLSWCGTRLPRICLERRFAKEYLSAVRDVVARKRGDRL